MENEIKEGEFFRTKKGNIFKLDKYWLFNDKYKKIDIVKHSPNLIDLICEGDYVNGKEVKHIADFEGINKPIKKLIFVDEKHLIPGETAENEDIETVVTKEQMESITYKVTKM